MSCPLFLEKVLINSLVGVVVVVANMNKNNQKYIKHGIFYLLVVGVVVVVVANLKTIEIL